MDGQQQFLRPVCKLIVISKCVNRNALQVQPPAQPNSTLLTSASSDLHLTSSIFIEIPPIAPL